jgi:hypothetical protein
MPRAQSVELAGAPVGTRACASAEPSASVLGRNKLSCRRVGNRSAIFKGVAKIPAAVIVPDDKYPGQFRVMASGQRPSDMVNLTRAVDAAFALVLRHQNKPEQETRRQSHT